VALHALLFAASTGPLAHPHPHPPTHPPQYAGNVLVYGQVHPCDGDWFGGLNAGNAEPFLDALLSIEARVPQALLRP
jgi:hypothetical protein